MAECTCMHVCGITWWRHQLETFFRVTGHLCGQWRGALMLSLICAWINDWINRGEAGDLRRYRAHYIVTVLGGLIRWLPQIHGAPCPADFATLLVSDRGNLNTGQGQRTCGVSWQNADSGNSCMKPQIMFEYVIITSWTESMNGVKRYKA